MSASNADAKNGLLDVLRGLAAIEVAAYHLKLTMFGVIDKGAPLGWRVFNILTGLGTEAVMLFFVLSGYLISRNVYQSIQRGRWSWMNYGVKRLTRLWIVLLPALLLTAFWDTFGERVLGGAVYQGLREGVRYGFVYPAPDALADLHSLRTFLGNLAFLQNGIAVPNFGINLSLWSLANEFWYYAVFPLIALAAFSTKAWTERAIFAVIFLVIAFALPFKIMLYGLIWLMGFGVYLLERALPARITTSRWLMAIAALFVVADLLVGRRVMSETGFLHDFVTGVAFSLLLLACVARKDGMGAIGSALASSSNFSYSLYLTHLPFTTFLLCLFADNNLWTLNWRSGLAYVGILAMVLSYGWLVYWLFERRTGEAQKYLLQRLSARTLATGQTA